MSSKQKSKVAQQNGVKAAGAKSPAGIKKSSMNALRHGCMAETLVLSNESQEKFDQLMQDYIDRFQPKDNVERGLVNEMVAARWRQQRLWCIHSATLDLEMDRQEQEIEKTMLQCSEPTRISIAFNSLAERNGLEALMRYETSFSRMHDRAMKALERLQQGGSQKQPASPAEPTSEAVVEPTPVPPVAPMIPVTCKPVEPLNQNLRNDAKSRPFPRTVEPSQVTDDASEPELP